MTDRKASEVLISLEEKVDFLIKNINNQNNDIKLILKKINSLNKESVNIPQTRQAAPLVDDELSPLEKKAMHARKMNENSEFERMAQQAGIDDEEEFQQNRGAAVVPQRRGSRTASSDNLKVTVTQVVTDNGGMALPIAQVTITDDMGSIISTSRTNIKGRWTASLEPGNYNVHVSKVYASDPNRPPIDKSYPIEVVFSEGKKLDLPPF